MQTLTHKLTRWYRSTSGYWLRRIVRPFKFTYQKLVRGFSDNELWNLDNTIAKFILPRLIRFKKEMRSGLPQNQEDTSRSLTQAEWDDILDNMIFAFNYAQNIYTKSCNKEDYKRYELGMRQFATYFLDLWD